MFIFALLSPTAQLSCARGHPCEYQFFHWASLVWGKILFSWLWVQQDYSLSCSAFYYWGHGRLNLRQSTEDLTNRAYYFGLSATLTWLQSSQLALVPLGLCSAGLSSTLTPWETQQSWKSAFQIKTSSAQQLPGAFLQLLGPGMCHIGVPGSGHHKQCPGAHQLPSPSLFLGSCLVQSHNVTGHRAPICWLEYFCLLQKCHLPEGTGQWCLLMEAALLVHTTKEPLCIQKSHHPLHLCDNKFFTQMLHLATVSKANLYLCRMMLQDGEWKSIWQMVTVSSMTVLNLSGNGRHFHDLSLLEFQLKMQIWNINYECSPINKSLGILSAALYVKKILKVLHLL